MTTEHEQKHAKINQLIKSIVNNSPPPGVHNGHIFQKRADEAERELQGMFQVALDAETVAAKVAVFSYVLADCLQEARHIFSSIASTSEATESEARCKTMETEILSMFKEVYNVADTGGGFQSSYLSFDKFESILKQCITDAIKLTTFRTSHANTIDQAVISLDKREAMLVKSYRFVYECSLSFKDRQCVSPDGDEGVMIPPAPDMPHNTDGSLIIYPPKTCGTICGASDETDKAVQELKETLDNWVPADSNDVKHPSHYHPGPFETRKVIKVWDLNFDLGNAIKYISRCDGKGKPIQDLEKAIQSIEFEIADRKAVIAKETNTEPKNENTV